MEAPDSRVYSQAEIAWAVGFACSFRNLRAYHGSVHRHDYRVGVHTYFASSGRRIGSTKCHRIVTTLTIFI